MSIQAHLRKLLPVANEYFDPGSQRAVKVHDLFARIATRYDLINDLQSFGLHRYWKKRVVQLAAPVRGDRGLDVCCGTGDIALRLQKAGAAATGLDFTEAMLTIARKRSLALQPLNTAPHWVQGDAQQLPFPDASFDIVTVGYGLRNLAHWQAGLAEMVRVAKPRARILVLDFGKPDNRLWRSVYFSYLRLFVPLLGRVFCGSAQAYSYILESLRHYPAQNGVAAEMKALGLQHIGIVNFLGGVMTINHGVK